MEIIFSPTFSLYIPMIKKIYYLRFLLALFRQFSFWYLFLSILIVPISLSFPTLLLIMFPRKKSYGNGNCLSIFVTIFFPICMSNVFMSLLKKKPFVYVVSNPFTQEIDDLYDWIVQPPIALLREYPWKWIYFFFIFVHKKPTKNISHLRRNLITRRCAKYARVWYTRIQNIGLSLQT